MPIVTENFTLEWSFIMSRKLGKHYSLAVIREGLLGIERPEKPALRCMEPKSFQVPNVGTCVLGFFTSVV